MTEWPFSDPPPSHSVMQASTSLVRLKSSAATAGFGNPVLATLELGGSIFVTLVAIVFPLLALLLAVGMVVLAVRWIGRRSRRSQATATPA